MLSVIATHCFSQVKETQQIWHLHDLNHRYRIYSCINGPFMTKKSVQKITLDLNTSHTQRPDPSNPRNQHNNCQKSVRKTEFIKPVLIVFKFRQFSAHSSSTKKFEIINLSGLNTKPLELISIVSSDLQNRHFFLTTSLLFTVLNFPLHHSQQSTSNDFSGLVTWQMLMSRAVLSVTRDSSKPFGVSSVYEISFQTNR